MSNFQATIFINIDDGVQVGSVDFIIPSLFEGMRITIKSGSKNYFFIVKSWEYIFSSFEEDKSGLIVRVDTFPQS